jgi:hypothetical protein
MVPRFPVAFAGQKKFQDVANKQGVNDWQLVSSEVLLASSR